MNVETILSQIDLGAMALPEFQRGYVWNRDQVRGLMDSLYRQHPVGGLLVWVTKTEQATARGDGQLSAGSVELLLDGQQRITSLYGIIRGKPPRFFEGNKQVFTDLYFNLDDESFEFYGPVKMRDNPAWISVTKVMQEGAGEIIAGLFESTGAGPRLNTYIGRVNRIENIKKVDFHIEKVVGDDKTVDVVVDIFNKVNSGGTKLSKGDLALAKICAEWPEARNQLRNRLNKWDAAGFHFRMEWLLRCVNAIVTGEAMFTALANVGPAEVQRGLEQSEEAIDTILNLVSSRLGLDHDRVLGSRYSFPLLAHYVVRRGGRLSDYRERDKLLYWYVHTFLWGRYAGSTETILNQDLGHIEDLDGGIDRLIEQLRRNRGDLTIHANDFLGWSRGARFYPLLYMLTRVYHAQDWETGFELSSNLLGRLSTLQMHHIFPRALLYKHGYKKEEVNALANFTFLTQETNLLVSDKNPAEYLERYEHLHPGAIESHWIPTDRRLWQVENYLEFLAARRELLANAANQFLNSLLVGKAEQVAPVPAVLDLSRAPETANAQLEDEEQVIIDTVEWVQQHGLPTGEMLYELADPNTGDPLAIFDLAWPDGLQEGLSQPVALLLNEAESIEQIANNAGFRYFTSVSAFREYVQREILTELLEDVAD